jgi:hypothetical protein
LKQLNVKWPSTIFSGQFWKIKPRALLSCIKNCSKSFCWAVSMKNMRLVGEKNKRYRKMFTLLTGAMAQWLSDKSSEQKIRVRFTQERMIYTMVFHGVIIDPKIFRKHSNLISLTIDDLRLHT